MSTENQLSHVPEYVLQLVLRFMHPRDVLALSLASKYMYYQVHDSEESLDLWYDILQTLPVNNPDSITWTLVKKRYYVQSPRQAALLQFDIDSVLTIGEANAYNQRHDVQCTLTATLIGRQNKIEEYEFEVKLINNGEEAQFLPFQPARRSWVEYFVLYIFETSTSQCIGFYEITHRKEFERERDRDVYTLMKPQGELVFQFEQQRKYGYRPYGETIHCSTVGDINQMKLKGKEITLVAATDFFPTVENPFDPPQCCINHCWVPNIEPGEAKIWKSGRIVSNAITIKL
jgi:hypothetical protein